MLITQLTQSLPKTPKSLLHIPQLKSFYLLVSTDLNDVRVREANESMV